MICIPFEYENESPTCSSGSGMYMSWSRHPGRRMAGSMISGRLVTPMIKTFFLELIPSIFVRIWLITQSAAPPTHVNFTAHHQDITAYYVKLILL